MVIDGFPVCDACSKGVFSELISEDFNDRTQLSYSLISMNFVGFFVIGLSITQSQITQAKSM